jgi:hypothetical protein
MDAEEAMKKHMATLDAEEVIAIRGDAASYAKQFLINKYREEYAECDDLDAYCRNRVVFKLLRKAQVDMPMIA